MNSTSSRYINRELSWLEFNQRVLAEARDQGIPPLEQLKFLAITGSNLDEFFMVRVGGLQMLREQGSTTRDPAGMTPGQQLDAISQRTHQMAVEQYTLLLEELEPRLAEAGIVCIRPDKATERQLRFVRKVFENEIFTTLTPMAITAADPFPVLVNLVLYACVRLEGPNADGEPKLAVIPFGRWVNRFVTLPSEGGYEYMLFEDVVRTFVGQFFPGENVVECVPFRVTRNADLSLREDMAADLLAGMEQVLDERKQSACVRLEIARGASETLLGHLQRVLEVADQDVYFLPGPLDLSALTRLSGLQGFENLKYPPWPPQPSPQIDLSGSMFDTLKQRDVLLCHPYESFDPVIRLIEEAALDPDVLAIKQILYRTSRDSPIVAALGVAAQRGKHVTAIVELKARFDEARNIEWARSLEQSGAQVIFGVKGLKTHAKLCIIVRRESHGIQRYVHFSTGNYNEITARLYTDVGLMTCNEELAADATNFFNTITGFSQPQQFRMIEAAPIGLREKLLELIEGETQRKRQGQKARIAAQLNALADPKIIDALYAASQAGVKIDLNVRGICCLRPGVPQLSENISVISILDRYLEHSRIIYFHHGGDPRVFISSADWMPRNLDRRVELLVPVEDPPSRARLIEILESYRRDNVKGRQLLADGSYRRLQRAAAQPCHRNQEHLYQLACDAVKQAAHSRRTTFEPHRSPGERDS